MNEAFWLEETTEFRELYMTEFMRFVKGRNETSISTLKSFLSHKDTPKIFTIVKEDYF